MPPTPTPAANMPPPIPAVQAPMIVKTPLQTLAEEASKLKSLFQTAHDAAHAALTNLKTAKIAGVNDAWVNAARGLAATALQHLNVQAQSLAAKVEAEKAAAEEAAAKAAAPPPAPKA